MPSAERQEGGGRRATAAEADGGAARAVVWALVTGPARWAASEERPTNQETRAMFIAHEIAIQLIVAVRPIVEAVRPRDKNLADQLLRAATAAAANTAEGGRRVGGDRLHSFRIASGEASEVKSWARIAAALGYVPESALADPLALEDRLQAVLWRLRTPRR